MATPPNFPKPAAAAATKLPPRNSGSKPPAPAKKAPVAAPAAAATVTAVANDDAEMAAKHKREPTPAAADGVGEAGEPLLKKTPPAKSGGLSIFKKKSQKEKEKKDLAELKEEVKMVSER